VTADAAHEPRRITILLAHGLLAAPRRSSSLCFACTGSTSLRRLSTIDMV
jgi:hypothetical protein